jgi:hypothetical protein
MKVFSLKVFTGIIIMAFLFLCHNESADAARITKTLDENTRIMPRGVVVTKWDNIPKFKKGTVVTLNEYGEVFEGILAADVSLPYETGISQDSLKPAGYTPMPFYVFSNTTTTTTNRVLSFKSGTKITFNDKGEVSKGTLNSSNQSIALNQSTYIEVSEGEVSFHKNGMLATCTLANDSYLRPVGWSKILTENYTNNSACPGFVEFKARKLIVLNDKGEVIKGTLNKETKLLSPVGIKVYEAETAVELDDEGIVGNAIKVPTV